MAEPTRVAFKLGGFKRPTINQTVSSIADFDATTTTNDAPPELVTGFDNGTIKSNAPIQLKKELVIPLQPNEHHKIFKLKLSSQKKKAATDETTNQLENEAKRALILEAQEANEAWDERTENDTRRVDRIEQQSINTFTSRLENDQCDPETEEEKPIENPDYDQVPIEDFGMAVMRGMGYKEDKGLGISNKKQVDVFVPESRPRGLGLGADRNVLERLNHLKRNLKQVGIVEIDDLCMEKGAFVLVEKGPHVDQYGTIESIDEDVTRLTVALAIGGTNKKKEVISISQYNVKLVTEKEFLKYSKYVNKSKADNVEKETSEELMKNYNHQDESKYNGRHHRKEHRDHHKDSKKSRRH